MAGIFDRFRCVRLRIEVRAVQWCELPSYKGSTLRGALGTALKKSCCGTLRRDCSTCSQRFTCLYVYFFETPLWGSGNDAARYRFAPHPFALNLALDGPLSLPPGSVWSFGMTIVGRAIEWVPALLEAVRGMGTLGIGKGRGTFSLHRVVSLDKSGNERETLYDGNRVDKPSLLLGLNGAEPASNRQGRRRFTLRFISPLRMIYQGDQVQIPEFHILIGNLVRRIENLARFHCDCSECLPVDELIAKARDVRLIANRTYWYDWQRYSHRQGRKMRLGGLVGEALYEGDPDLFEPYLTAGTWVNVGKATAFGLGRYALESVTEARTFERKE